MKRQSLCWLSHLVAVALLTVGCTQDVDESDEGDGPEGIGGQSTTSEYPDSGAGGTGGGGEGGHEPVCGGWHDTTHGLCWQEPPAPVPMSRYDADDYCEDLDWGGHQDWRLPIIDELRSLVRGCPGTELGGACRVTDGSSSAVQEGPCWGCNCGAGPAGGCYWDSALGTACGELSGDWDDFYISDSPLAGATTRTWGIHYRCGVINPDLSSNGEHLVRCVRDAP